MVRVVRKEPFRLRRLFCWVILLSEVIVAINFDDDSLKVNHLYSKGTELQRFRGDRRSVQSDDNEVIKYLNFRKLFLVKYNCQCWSLSIRKEVYGYSSRIPNFDNYGRFSESNFYFVTSKEFYSLYRKEITIILLKIIEQ